MVCRVVTYFCNFLHVFWDTSYTRLLVPLSVFMHRNHCLKQVKQLTFHYSCGSILCSSWLIVECVKTIFVFVIVLMSCPGWFLGLDENLAGTGGANTLLQDLTNLCQQDKVCTKAHLRRRTLELKPLNSQMIYQTILHCWDLAKFCMLCSMQLTQI
jgi:hypothetical protein